MTAPVRRKVLELLAEEGEMYISQIARELRRTWNSINNAVACLEKVGAVTRARRGRHVYIAPNQAKVQEYYRMLSRLHLDKPVPCRIVNVLYGQPRRLSEVEIADLLCLTLATIRREAAMLVTSGVIKRTLDSSRQVMCYQIRSRRKAETYR